MRLHGFTTPFSSRRPGTASWGQSIVQPSPETFQFQDDGRIPNSALSLVVYRRVLPAEAGAIERRFAANGWTNSWRDGVYPYHHFHSIAHEVLGVAAGEAMVQFGGPQGRALRLGRGDVVVIPAGVGHRNQGSSEDFLIVGAYPDGADWDVRRGDPAERAEVLRNLARVTLPRTDPVHGAGGPLLSLWNGQKALASGGGVGHMPGADRSMRDRR
jgi:uncharacterized protein YjlB